MAKARVVKSDCDGYTSSAVLLNYLHSILPSSIPQISYSFHEGKVHGIDLDAVPPWTTLVIAPDSSSEQYDIHKELAERGIDVCIADHHFADRVSEYACVVNNQLCDYPNKALSGVGIVYKLCQRFDELLGENKADELLDLVAIGNVGDMMSLRSMETCYLIRQGLSQIRNPFITTMVEKNAFQLKDNLTPISVAFYIVPFVNAITRVGTIQEKEILFKSMLEWEAYKTVPSTKRGCKGQEETIVEQAVRICTNVKNRQNKEQEAAVEQVKKIIEEEKLTDHKIILIKVEEPEYNKAVTGLIANRIMAEYQHPVGLLSKTTYEGEVAWMGSARGISNSKLEDFRSFCANSGLSFLHSGHPQAFGLGIFDKNINKFIEYSDEALKDINFSPSYKVDFIYNYSNVNPQTILDLGEHKELWGQDIPEAMIAVENIPVTSSIVTLMSRDRNPTLKIQLDNGVSCIKFKSSEEEYESLLNGDYGCTVITLVGKPEVNHYRDSITPQIIITDYQIVSKNDWFF